MPAYLTDEEREAFTEAADLARQANELLQRARLALVAVASATPDDGDSPGILGFSLVADVMEHTSGLAYRLTPQPEWTGGDPTDPKNTRYRRPHL